MWEFIDERIIGNYGGRVKYLEDISCNKFLNYYFFSDL